MKKYLLTLLAFFLSISFLLAQVPPPPDYHENAGPGAPDPSALPVDQYVLFLLLIAATIGVYFLWQKRTATTQF